MNSKIMVFFQFMYKYFQTSFYFWIKLLKGLVIYSLIPSLCGLFLVIKDINTGADDEQNMNVRELYNKYFGVYKNYRLPSFIYMIILILLYSGLYFLNKAENEVFIIPIILFIYLLFMTLLMLIYSTVFIAFKGMDAKKGNIFGFLSVFKHPVSTVSIVVILILLYFSISYNFAFFVAFGPFLFGLGVVLSLYKLIEN